MPSKILYKSSIARDLRKLDKDAQDRVLREIRETLSSSPNAGEPLKGEFKGLYKLRVGEYRVIYTKMRGEALLILRIRHRSKAYD